MNASRTNTAEKLRNEFLDELSRHPDFSEILSEDFFATDVEGIHSPLLLPDLEKAVTLLRQAIDNKETVLVAGDRDVDGVASTALLSSFLRENHEKMGGKLSMKVSDQGDDYGLSGNFFEEILTGPAGLIILLDMGTSNGPEIKQLLDAGKQVIILDHHQIHDRTVDDLRCAFVNPMRMEEKLEHEGKIATVGLVFKLLLGFALSHTKEWRIIHYVVLDSDPEKQLEEGKAAGHAFRCGSYLGKFDSIENLKSLSEYEGFEFLPVDPVTAYDDISLWNPHREGKKILSRLIRARPRLREFVISQSDLAAVGLVTDMVPLIGENRSLVRIGIGQAAYSQNRGTRTFRTGYAALIRELNPGEEKILSRDLGWTIGPALNAAGRMGQTSLALELLMENDREKAAKLAKSLRKLNEERKLRTVRNELIVEKHFEENPAKLDLPVIFCYHSELEPGVSGIVATRLMEKYGRPVIYINRDGKHAKGSARSMGGRNILHLLDTASHLLIQFGGHPEAAGFSIEYDKIDELESIMGKNAGSFFSENAQMQSEISHHLIMKPFQLNHDTYRELEWLEPFGASNPQPVIKIENTGVHKLKFYTDGRHAFFSLPEAPSYLECVVWKRGRDFSEAAAGNKKIDLFGCLEKTNFRGMRNRLLLRVDYFQNSI